MKEGSESTREELAGYILSIFPIFHKKLLKKGHGSTVSRQQINLLHKILFHPNETMSFYCEKTMISRPNMTKLVNGLIEEGYIIRNRGKNDRRKVTLTLTEKGKELTDQHLQSLKKQVVESTARLSEEDIQQLAKSFESIRDIFSKLGDEDDEETEEKEC